MVAACLRRNQPGPYQLQAAINAVHTDSASAAETDWAQILALYDQLLAQSPTPVVALNRAVALAEVRGPAAGLADIDLLDIEGYHLFHATRADLLRRLGRLGEAAEEYTVALSLVRNEAERRFLEDRLFDVDGMKRARRTSPAHDRGKVHAPCSRRCPSSSRGNSAMNVRLPVPWLTPL